MATKTFEITADTALWERLPYDTKRSFEYFNQYYFTQESGSRSLNEAYRQATGKRRRANGRLYEAPSNWQRWANGQASRGEQVYLKITAEDGNFVIRKAYTWAERAEAWDRQVREDRRRRQRKQAEKIDDQLLDAMERAAEKLFKAVQKYKPQGDEGLTELTLAARRLADVRLILLGEEVEDEEAKAEGGGDMVTQLERFDRLTELLEKGKGRLETAENVEQPSRSPKD